MKNIELQQAFELETNTSNDPNLKILSFDTEYWLNTGLEKFYKTRYSGLNTKREGFEQSEKRIDDLRTLIKKESLAVTNNNTIYSVILPEDYLFTLGERTGIVSNNKCWPKDDLGNPKVKYTDVIEATIENIDSKLNNSLSDHKLHNNNAKPLRTVSGNSIELITDGNYSISDYTLTYLKKPNKIDIHTNPLEEYTDMPEHTHMEIVKLAAQMYLENQVNPRYNSYSNEVNTME